MATPANQKRKANTAPEAPRKWRNRIVGHGEEDPEQLLANPRNWRIHPKAQQDALAGVLSEVGWVQSCIVNKTTNFVVDGHARAALAITHHEKVPVVYVELTPEEEAIILATLDPLSAMAGTDKDLLRSLTGEITVKEAALADLLDDLAAASEKGAGVGVPIQDQTPVIQYALIFETEHQQQKWFDFLGALKRQYPNMQTIAGRLVKYIGEHNTVFVESK